MRLLEGGDEDVRGEESMLRVLPVGKRLQVAEPAIFRAHNRQVADLNPVLLSRPREAIEDVALCKFLPLKILIKPAEVVRAALSDALCGSQCLIQRL